MAETYIQVEELPAGASIQVEKKYNTTLTRWEVHKVVSVAGLPDSIVRSEAQLLLALDHDHIVDLYSAEFVPGTDDLVSFSMPFVEGGSVAQLIGDGGLLSARETKRLGLQIGSALSYSHNEAGFLHRDVKAGNILLSGDHRDAFLTDFGSAARLDDAGRTGNRGFELFYADGHAYAAGYFTTATDVYGLGVALFEACSGPLPFDEFDPEVAYARIGDGRRPVPDRCYENFAPHVPEDLRRVLRKAMRRDPASRYSTAAQFAQDLGGLEIIDWQLVDGDGRTGRWEGRWPSLKHEDVGRLCRVETDVLKAGPSKGLVRASAYFLADTGWRRIIPDETFADGGSDLASFFDRVDDKVAQVRAAR